MIVRPILTSAIRETMRACAAAWFDPKAVSLPAVSENRLRAMVAYCDKYEAWLAHRKQRDFARAALRNVSRPPVSSEQPANTGTA